MLELKVTDTFYKKIQFCYSCKQPISVIVVASVDSVTQKPRTASKQGK